MNRWWKRFPERYVERENLFRLLDKWDRLKTKNANKAATRDPKNFDLDSYRLGIAVGLNMAIDDLRIETETL